MPGTNQHSDWEDPPQPSSVLRKPRQPVAVYDLSKKKDVTFFSCLGKLTVLCVLSFLLAAAIYWFLHQNRPPAGVTPGSVSVSSPAAPKRTVVVGDPPQVGFVNFWGITTSGVTISWSTNVPATTSVAYGTSPQLGQSTSEQTALTISHGATLDGLASGTTHYFAVKSTGANGVTATSSTYSFTTAVKPGIPVISDIQVVRNGQKILISWKTSRPTYSYIQLGTSTAYDRWSTRTELTTDAHPTIGWLPSGIVHYQLVSIDANGNKAVSPDYTINEPQTASGGGGFASRLRSKLHRLKNLLLRRGN